MIIEAGANDTVMLSRSQALQIMAISIMLKDGELEISGEDAATALEALADAGEEIALQIGGYQ